MISAVSLSTMSILKYFRPSTVRTEEVNEQPNHSDYFMLSYKVKCT